MFIKIYLITLPIFLALDFTWITVVAKNFYSQQIGFLMSKNPNLVAALIFYLIYIAAMVVFVIAPAVDKKLWTQALFLGAFLGFAAYATYDLTNLATVKNWPLLLTLVDLAWGTVLTSSVSVAAYFVASKLLV